MRGPKGFIGPNGESCELCYFAELEDPRPYPLDQQLERARCRRYPDSPIIAPVLDWCGEFRDATTHLPPGLVRLPRGDFAGPTA